MYFFRAPVETLAVRLADEARIKAWLDNPQDATVRSPPGSR